jgi:DNA polymerase I
MQFQTFDSQISSRYPIGILVPKLSYDGMMREYIEPGSLDPKEVIAYQLYQTGKKTSASDQKEFLSDLLPVLDDLKVQYLLVGEGEYFKTLTGVNKADAYLGYVLPNTYPAHMKGRFHVLYIPNYRQVFYDPAKTQAKITQVLDSFWNHRQGHYREPGCSIIQFSAYPSTVADIAGWLEKLLKYAALTCDIEGFSLRHYKAGIGTISFAWTKHQGIAFAVDLGENPPAVRKLLIKFFIESRKQGQNLKFHHASFDVMVMIYQLYMDHLIDTEGLLNGLEIFLDRPWDDTKIISYLATNSTAGNELGLKTQAQEFAGNYAVEDIKDITKIPLPQLLEYNLVDALSTWFVYEKHYQTMVDDDQLEIYEELMKPALVDIIQMQLTGMPIDMERVQEAREILGDERAEALRKIQSHDLVREFVHTLREEHVEQRNSELKVKRISMNDPETLAVEFNPNSTPQKQRLFFEVMELPVLERTKTKQPATGADVLEKLKAYTTDPSEKALLDAFLDFAAVDKIYGTFIPAMEEAELGPDGCYYMFGNFNLGGTVSGRLSSSEPNMQTIPSSGTKYAKLIKSCFVAPKGSLFVGLDFDSLEDKISALTTKDTNKIKVYVDGYDGHCLRAQSYFSDEMPDIELAPSGAQCYKVLVGDKTVYFHEKETVTYLGQNYTGGDLYALLTNHTQPNQTAAE